MDHLISARRPDLVIANKNVSADHSVKLKESEKRFKYVDLAKELKKQTIEHESDGGTNCNWCVQNSHQEIGTETGGPGDKRTRGEHPNYSIIEIGQNIKKSPGDMRRLAVTQISIGN